MKIFKYHNAEITIRLAGHSQYTLHGLGRSARCTDFDIWSWCDDEANERKRAEARSAAYQLLKAAPKGYFLKTYKFSYLDEDGNELTTKEISEFNIKDAHKRKDIEFAACKIADCVEIKVSLVQ
ncbi:MAG: hypothetical protein KA519_02055 [Bacteroides sp.]|uniref:hypothetical protein n=1 Tax=Bacteroides sp. TaxID=29523 RepID=UPI001B5ECF0D|nr:hypothetical protein [Bacteroides sp.]MBP6065087.1 hypothetical protein [Bacteroides sp.]MBP6066851.1 hypothetical protein [Bacteroides sp.]MBP9586070.1 hypothetical protein [Bacteroides sp.]